MITSMGMTRVTVTLPEEQVKQIRQSTGNISGFVAEAIDDRLRRQQLDEYLAAYQAERGAFTADELHAAEVSLTPWAAPVPVAA